MYDGGLETPDRMGASMGRSVVRAGAPRCTGCTLPPRWCVCDLLPPVVTDLAVHVLIHRHERGKPSSTGALIGRAVAGATCHVFQRATRFHPARGMAALAPGGDVWILDPAGEPLPPRGSEPAAPPPRVVIVDGTWREAAEMNRSLTGLGRRVRLPEAAVPGRYWLREPPTPDKLSSADALVRLLGRLDRAESAARLRLHFELHVYATLLARGRREMAERYLGHSPLLTEAADTLDRFHRRVRRPDRDEVDAGPVGGRRPQGNGPAADGSAPP